VQNVETIKMHTDLMFHNLRISMDTADWDAPVCGAPAWRYIYHTIHSADKFFINPGAWTEQCEPTFHTRNLDWPDTPAETALDRETLYAYFEQVRRKTLEYLDSLTDGQLNESPESSEQTRLDLILGQFRHMYAHIGILNGVTVAHENRYPRVVNPSDWRSDNLPGGLYDEDVRL